MNFTYYSLFARFGGMTIGLETLGGKCLGAWEYDPLSNLQHAQKAHKLLHPSIPLHGDVTKINPEELEDFDILAFTPPCQAFSIAGKRGGFEDTRGTLTFDALRVAKVKKPKFLFMENVKGLLSHDKGNTLETIIHAINEIGYVVDFTILNSKYFNVPQSRERLYLVAVRDDLIKHEPWENIKGNTSLIKSKKRYLDSGVKTFNFEFPNNSEEKCKMKDIIESDETDVNYMLPINIQEQLMSIINEIKIEESSIIFNRKKIVKYTEIGNTLMANPPLKMLGNQNCITAILMKDKAGSVVGVRKLKPIECLRMQSIPEKYIHILKNNFTDGQIYKFAGNGLTINVINSIGKNILNYIL